MSSARTVAGARALGALVWSKVKTWLRAQGFRSLDALIPGVGRGLATITPQEARTLFQHCGYTLQ